MTVVLSDRTDLTLDAFRRVAWNGEDARLDADALRQIGAAREAFMALIEDGSITVYGVTSGFGDRARLQLTAEERARQAREATDRGVSFGAALPERVTRGIVFARLANIVGGHAAIRPELGRTLTRRGTRRGRVRDSTWRERWSLRACPKIFSTEGVRSSSVRGPTCRGAS